MHGESGLLWCSDGRYFKFSNQYGLSIILRLLNNFGNNFLKPSCYFGLAVAS